MREQDQCEAIIQDGRRVGQRCKRAVKHTDTRMCNWHHEDYVKQQLARADWISAHSWSFPQERDTGRSTVE